MIKIQQVMQMISKAEIEEEISQPQAAALRYKTKTLYQDVGVFADGSSSEWIYQTINLELIEIREARRYE